MCENFIFGHVSFATRNKNFIGANYLKLKINKAFKSGWIPQNINRNSHNHVSQAVASMIT